MQSKAVLKNSTIFGTFQWKTLFRCRLTLPDHVQPKIAYFHLPTVVNQATLGTEISMDANERLMYGNHPIGNVTHQGEHDELVANILLLGNQILKIIILSGFSSKSPSDCPAGNASKCHKEWAHPCKLHKTYSNCRCPIDEA